MRIGFVVAWVGMMVWVTGVAAREVAPAPRELPCLSQDALQPDYTPSELARVVRNCTAEGRYEDAMRAYYTYSAYGLFDQQRVRDESAHIVLQELSVWMFGGLPYTVTQDMKAVADRLRSADSPLLRETCAVLRRLGPPKYRPSYMIVYGIWPRKSPDDWKTEGFNAVTAWEHALSGVNDCPPEL